MMKLTRKRAINHNIYVLQEGQEKYRRLDAVDVGGDSQSE